MPYNNRNSIMIISRFDKYAHNKIRDLYLVEAIKIDFKY